MTALGIVIGIQALVLLAMAIRQSGIKSDALDADHARHSAEKQLQETSREFVTYRMRTQYQFESLRQDISELEGDLALCAGPGDRRRRLERLLSKAGDRENGGNPPKLPLGPRSGTIRSD